MLALTATATPRVQQDIVQQLGLRSCLVFRSSFNRTNLRYAVKEKKGGVDKATKELFDMILKDHCECVGGKRVGVQSGVIYCHSKVLCEKVAARLDALLAEQLGTLGRARARVR